MAPARGGGGGGAALSALKETLVRQFGASTREVVEAEVDSRLGVTRGGRLQREDLDAIEQSVLAAVRHRRSGGVSRQPPRQRSSPELVGAGTAVSSSSRRGHLGYGSSSSVASSVGTPPRKSVPAPAQAHGRAPLLAPVPPATPQPTASLTRSASATASINVNKRIRPAPYGLDLGSTDDDAASERSRVVVRPKYPVPLRPKLKPMDHWDMIVAFDAEKYRQEEIARQDGGHAANHAKFRNTLDDQMAEIRELREQEAAELRQEREDMEAQLEENKRLAEAEEAKEQEMRDIMKKANDEAMLSIEKRKQKAKAKKEKEQRDVTKWLADEKARQEQEAAEQAAEHARKCQTAREEMEAALAEAERRRKQREAEEKQAVADAQKAMDDAAGANRKAVADRMARIEELSRVFGAEVAKRDAEDAARLEAQIKKIQEDGERMAKEDLERRKSEKERKVKEMLEIRAKQVVDKEKDQLIEVEANKKQATIWKQEYEAGLAKDQANADKRREARAKQDKELIDQMRESLVVHPLQFGMTNGTQRQELALNRVLFEQMAADGFKTGVIGGFVNRATDKGKLTAHPSVGPSGVPIHELELGEPDVC